MKSSTWFTRRYLRLIEQFGAEGVTGLKPYDYLIEECAELITAIYSFDPDYIGRDIMRCAEIIISIQHKKRGRVTGETTHKESNIAEEMAHVITLIDCTRHYLSITDDRIKHYQQVLIDRYVDTPNDGHHTD